MEASSLLQVVMGNEDEASLGSSPGVGGGGLEPTLGLLSLGPGA